MPTPLYRLSCRLLMSATCHDFITSLATIIAANYHAAGSIHLRHGASSFTTTHHFPRLQKPRLPPDFFDAFSCKAAAGREVETPARRRRHAAFSHAAAPRKRSRCYQFTADATSFIPRFTG